MRVIVVEDNILFCDYICNFLQNADYQTVKAYRQYRLVKNVIW